MGLDHLGTAVHIDIKQVSRLLASDMWLSKHHALALGMARISTVHTDRGQQPLLGTTCKMLHFAGALMLSGHPESFYWGAQVPAGAHEKYTIVRCPVCGCHVIVGAF